METNVVPIIVYLFFSLSLSYISWDFLLSLLFTGVVVWFFSTLCGLASIMI